ncbi:MAG: undecaprenyldiphospho-muramoylpentapeptide beta-N-acetylglucosaminyltransferase [Chloroflexi bacterium]|jgi:UDP-N-acetylglucosamine--N-acetylmuramyl-(pentapeptide) pyrophosphoryl-undecaprenol N-acetylglucosamine transferase|nr:undecaprenyldiphospho-muramoylpentapeptide beta-N-acetylglucosaminyltransferase [Chloroflexota bacterium]
MMQIAVQNLSASPYSLSASMKVLVCAGGTGGGIYPALAAVSELENEGLQRNQVLWIGTQGEMEETLIARYGIQLRTIRGGAIVGVPLQTSIRNTIKLTWSIGTASKLIRHFRPDVMFMTGGYMSPPVALAAWLHRVPIGIFLPDVEPGSSIKAVLPLAKRIACTTDGSRPYVRAEKMVVTGYPVRPEIRKAAHLTKEEALAKFNLHPDRSTLFVFGGSRGALNINRALMSALPELLKQLQVIHISGSLTWPEVESNAQQLSAEMRTWYRPFPYLHDDMGSAFRAADLVVARAGASMLGEGPAFGVPAILVPLTFAWRYQKVNADYLTERGAAIQLTDDRLADELLPTVLALLQDKARLLKMSKAAKALDIPEATSRLARFITSLGEGKAI